MATAVTLKESDGSEIYPVTDISLVNNGIHAVDIQATTPVPAVETAMIADGAVTSDKIDWTTVASTSTTPTKNSTYVGNVETNYVRVMEDGLVFVSLIFKLAVNITAGSNVTVFSNLPGSPLGYYDIVGLDASAGKPIRLRLSGGTSATLNIAYDAATHGASSDIVATFVYPTR